MAAAFHSETLPFYWSMLQQYRHCHSSSFRSFVCVTVCQRPTLLFKFNRLFFMYWWPNRENVRFESQLLALVFRYRDSLSLYLMLSSTVDLKRCEFSHSCRSGCKYRMTFLKNVYVYGLRIFNLICCFMHMWNCTSFLFRPAYPVFFKFCFSVTVNFNIDGQTDRHLLKKMLVWREMRCSFKKKYNCLVKYYW